VERLAYQLILYQEALATLALVYFSICVRSLTSHIIGFLPLFLHSKKSNYLLLLEFMTFIGIWEELLKTPF